MSNTTNVDSLMDHLSAPHRGHLIQPKDSEDQMDSSTLIDFETSGLSASHLPPVPLSRERAKAQGLKVFPSWQSCKLKGHGNMRRTHDGQCVACIKVQHDYLEKVKAEGLEELKAQIRREVIRDLKREQKAAETERLRQEKEEAKALAKAQREQEKKTAKLAKARAEREALKASQSVSNHPPIDEQSAACLGSPDGLGGPDVAPWD